MLVIWIVSPKKWIPSCGVNKDTLARWYQKIKKKSEKQKNSKKIEKQKNKKYRIRKNQKIKNQKNQKNRKRKEFVFSSPGQMCVFYLYPILNSQQCVKRGSCRRPILSGLLFVFLIFVGPQTHLHHGPSLGFEPISLCWHLFYRVFESFCVKLLFLLNFCIKNVSCQKCL